MKDSENITIKRPAPKTTPDKREMMLFRETLKGLFIALIVSLMWLGVLIHFDKSQKSLNINNEKTIVKLNKKIDSLLVNDKIIPIKKEIDYSDLCVVLKASKDFRKYFVSYKKYYTKDKYDVVVKQINFTEFMMIKENDTLTNINFLNE